MLTIVVTNGYARKITAAPTKLDGTPATLDGPLQIRLAGTDNSGATGFPVDGDPLSVWVVGTGTIGGNTGFEVFADAALGPEVREIKVAVSVHVKDQEASNLGLTVSEEVLASEVNPPPVVTPTPPGPETPPEPTPTPTP